MKIAEVKKMTDPFDRLCYWIRERESIRLKRERGEPAPWTDDEILSSYRFCNVRRMDDKVSRWLMDNWYGPHHGHKNMLIAATLARQLNNPESLQEIGFPIVWNPDRCEKILNARTEKGLKNFSAAYMITGTLGGKKVHQIVRKVVDPIFRSKIELNTDSMKDSAEALIPFAGFSTFIAGQVVADLRWASPGEWSDRDSWAPKGPGSVRGLNILYGDPLDHPMKVSVFERRFGEVLAKIRANIPKEIFERMEAHDYQNCLCESFKYHKTLFGLGRPKQKYPGGGS